MDGKATSIVIFGALFLQLVLLLLPAHFILPYLQLFCITSTSMRAFHGSGGGRILHMVQFVSRRFNSIPIIADSPSGSHISSAGMVLTFWFGVVLAITISPDSFVWAFGSIWINGSF